MRKNFYRVFPVSCVFMNAKQGYLYISQIATEYVNTKVLLPLAK